MKIEWKIDYTKKNAKCLNLKVSIIKIEEDDTLPITQKIGDDYISLGFQKIDTNSKFLCLITYISNELWKNNLKDNDILPNYMSQLDDLFNEKFFNNPMASKNQFNKICVVCGLSFTGTGKSKFCSNRCKQKDKNSKKKKRRDEL
ncbi:hypothetical protein [Sulfurimonas sp.]|uniref:hypothetical protein n=1 Tax=Sulfurimonas sp. TaxID=2022749 RepID=UPI002B4A64B4|nr:hypothetical protein [Sulfurimonas sp.]